MPALQVLSSECDARTVFHHVRFRHLQTFGPEISPPSGYCTGHQRNSPGVTVSLTNHMIVNSFKPICTQTYVMSAFNILSRGGTKPVRQSIIL